MWQRHMASLPSCASQCNAFFKTIARAPPLPCVFCFLPLVNFIFQIPLYNTCTLSKQTPYCLCLSLSALHSLLHAASSTTESPLHPSHDCLHSPFFIRKRPPIVSPAVVQSWPHSSPPLSNPFSLYPLPSRAFPRTPSILLPSSLLFILEPLLSPLSLLSLSFPPAIPILNLFPAALLPLLFPGSVPAVGAWPARTPGAEGAEGKGKKIDCLERGWGPWGPPSGW